MYTSGKAGIPETEKTWAKHLQDSGYITQAVGNVTIFFKQCILKWTFSQKICHTHKGEHIIGF